MIPIPPEILVIGAAGAILVGFGGGWALRDNIADAEAGRAATALLKAKDAAIETVNANSTKYEQWRSEQEPARVETRNTIREIFRDTPVPAECAAPDALVGLLADKAASANAATTGQSGAVVPADTGPTASVGRPRSRGVGG